MGYFAHDTVLATSWYSDCPDIEAFRQTLPEKWRPLVIGPIPGVVNFGQFYAFLPDGSKEGWQDSHDGDKYRQQFIELFKDAKYPDVVTVRFGGDYQAEFGKPHAEAVDPRKD